jgi:hypothetical protein
MYWDFVSGVDLSKAHNTVPRPPYTLYTCIQYTYSHRDGGGEGGRVDQREGENGNRGRVKITKLG